MHPPFLGAVSISKDFVIFMPGQVWLTVKLRGVKLSNIK